jgi:proteasome lid subunit RPN8/RPN11
MASVIANRDDWIYDAEMVGQVHRLTPLPLAPARGHLVVSETVKNITEIALRGFAGPDGRHEGIIFWAGRETDADQIVVTAVVPRATHGKGFVHVSADQVGQAAYQCRNRRLVLLAQVHSHPGDDTRHSDADDDLVLMAREGMFSIVVARYGDAGISAAEGAGVHQFQDSRWVKVSNPATSLIIAPTGMCT